MKRIPMDALQRAVYEFLTKHQTTPIYDDVPTGAELPFVLFGDFEAVPGGAKAFDAAEVTLALEIYSDQQGRREVNEIADDLCTLFEYSFVEIADDFEVEAQRVESFAAYPEETGGYHGTLTIKFLIHNRKE